MIYKIEDIVRYSKCPLSYRYNSWVNEGFHYNNAITRAFYIALSSYLTEASRDVSTVEYAHQKAIHNYKAKLIEYDNKKLFDRGLSFTDFYIKGIALLNELVDEIDPRYHRPIHGNINNFSYPFKDDVITGDLCGLISYYDSSKDDRFYCVPVVRESYKKETLQDIIYDGFYYAAIRNSLGELKQHKIKTLIIDPVKFTFNYRDIDINKVNTFLTVTDNIINSLKSNVCVPNIGDRCYTCKFYKSCLSTDCSTTSIDFKKKQFRERYESIN